MIALILKTQPQKNLTTCSKKAELLKETTHRSIVSIFKVEFLVAKIIFSPKSRTHIDPDFFALYFDIASFSRLINVHNAWC